MLKTLQLRRLALAGLLAISLSLGLLGGPTQSARAHTGTGLCGTTDLWPVAVYMWQYTNQQDGSHYHTWRAPDSTLFDNFCGYWL